MLKWTNSSSILLGELRDAVCSGELTCLLTRVIVDTPRNLAPRWHAFDPAIHRAAHRKFRYISNPRGLGSLIGAGVQYRRHRLHMFVHPLEHFRCDNVALRQMPPVLVDEFDRLDHCL